MSGWPEPADTGGSSIGRASVPPPQAGPVQPAGPVSPRGRASVPISPPASVPISPPAPAPISPPAPAPNGAQPQSPPPTPRRRRRVLLIVGLALLVVLAGVGGLVVTRPGPLAGWLADQPTAAPRHSAAAPSPEPPPPPVLAAAGSGAGTLTEAGVRRAIGGLVAVPALGPRVNISVVDVAADKVLFESRPDALTVPASTTKLVTAAAVLSARGPAYRLTTRVVAGESPGEVVIIGGGDPTLGVEANELFPGAARLDRLAAQVKKALGGQQPTRVTIDGSLFTGPTLGPGWDPDIVTSGQGARITALSINAGRVRPAHRLVGGDERFSDPSRAAGVAFARALGVATSAVRTGQAPAAPTAAGASAAPPGANDGPVPGTELGRVVSPPLIRIVDWMLQLSDNVLAESLARQVALVAHQPASFAGAAVATKAAVTALGLPADESALVDNSGLSRRNRLTPRLLTDLLALAAGGTRPALTDIFGGLPVAGWSGTLQDRFGGPRDNRVGQGLVRAKTGTLTGVSAISGILVTGDGRVLAFALMADAVPGNADTARTALDRIAAKLVTCGCS